jgi:NitT/TauT family transport system substrate-binding protein
VTRLEKEASGKVFLEDRDVITTWLISSTKFLNEHKDLAKKIAEANKELTQWIKAHPIDAQSILVNELKAETRTEVAADSVSRSMQRINLTDEVSPGLIQKAVRDSKDAGFWKGSTDTSKLVAAP